MGPEAKEAAEKHGVIFALWDGNKLQLEKRTKRANFYGFTIIPGGAVESGETLEEALFREVREEYRVQVLDNRKLGTVSTTEDSGILNVRHVYLVTHWDGTLSNPEGENQHIEATIEDAFVLCEHPLSRVFLRMIEDAVN